ncbi:C6 domain protein [Oesophagostomum dentatum]|uniref:C6 domain protein n=1 Tax=Oesophagostomum dentatum TaxID=61180 RepID=A0A0B1TLI5_OESDE|nr:C6 domain protein [Oesophagostomum dentatum]
MTKEGAYNGMMVLDHTADSNGCKHVEAGESSTLYVNEKDAMLSGVGSHLLRLSCDKEGRWVTSEGGIVSNVSCLVDLQTNGSTEPPETATEITTTTATSLPPPGTVPCASCPRLSVLPLTSGYNNGFTTLLTSTDGVCKTVELTCEGSNITDELAVVISGTIFEQGTGRIKMNLTCNDMMTWTTTNGYAVPHMSCGIKIAPSTPTVPATSTTVTTTTTTTTTSAATTTTVASSKCGQCPNMQPIAAPSLSAQEANGMLVLDHYYEFFSGCRVVVIRCSADAGYENATILFNGNAGSMSAPERISSSLTCTSEGIWERLNEEITSTACRVVRRSGNTAQPPIISTTPITTTTTTAAGTLPCSNCNRQLVNSVPTGYTNGFLTMDTYNTGACINVELSCSAPDGASDVALIDAFGRYLSRTSVTTNLTLSCTNQTEWITPSGTVVNSFSCAAITREIFSFLLQQMMFVNAFLLPSPTADTYNKYFSYYGIGDDNHYFSADNSTL